MVNMVSAPWEDAPLLVNGCGLQGQNSAALLQGSGMPAGFHYRNLV